MTDDLYKLFDLDRPLEKIPFHMDPTETSPSTSKAWSSTALQTDDWDLQQGKRIYKPWQRTSGIDELAMADFFAAAWQSEPTLVEHCLERRRWEFMDALMTTPEFESLRKLSRGNMAVSELTAEKFAEQYKELVQSDKEREAERKRMPAHRRDDSKERAEDETACYIAAAAAAEEADEAAEECMELVGTLGMGYGPGGVTVLDPNQLKGVYERVKNNPHLRRICELAGRYIRVAQAKQRVKTKHGYEDMVGICLDDRVEMLLDEELAALVDPDLELDTARRLMEKETLAREYHGEEKQGRGPIWVVVDTSGSMYGEPTYNAKGMALGMAYVARQQNRWCCLVDYSGDTGEKLLVLKPGKWDQGLLLDWLLNCFGRGSDLDVPLDKMPGWWQAIKPPKGKTDVIFISDFAMIVPDQVGKDFLKWKKEVQARVISLAVGSGSMPQTVEPFSDEVHVMEAVSINEKGVELALSI